MGKKVTGILIIFLFVLSSSVLAQNIIIGVIDVNKVLNESKEGIEAKEKMKGRYDELQKKLDAKQDELKKMKEEIDKQKIILGKEKIKEKEDGLEKEMVEFRTVVAESEKEMRDTESAYTQGILKKIKEIVERYVEEKGFNLVIDRSGGVVHADEELDITEDVLEILNKEYASAGNESK